MFENLLGIFRKRPRFEEQLSHPKPNNNCESETDDYNDDDDDDENYACPAAWNGAHINNLQIDRPYNVNERFVTILDQLDARVEKFRKDALNLQEKKDYLLMSMDLIKSNEMLQTMSEAEREEIMLYIQRVSSRLGTVELNVRTVRDKSQEDSLSQINALIDTMIKMGDPVMSRQRCQLYLNACCTNTMDPSNHLGTVLEADAGPIDKKFESALLGCTLDDQKNIKKRLQALMGYLNKQTVTN
ncbi:BAG family molecular chaperone regulator 2 isoform X2 [Drosophila innubila]|uniref:BAG family molecular chaperone regulator 2 isoform X2 n=1 Tax=Drosophila innubila TaxID=198719 RepID=UPI00148DD84C|nr:BAG family molecular chaperone regulator 2 isoform X2 [Drosophila innubila]